MQASEGEAETDSMFASSNNSRPAGRTSFATAAAGRGAGGGGGRSKGLLLVVLLIIAGIFGGSLASLSCREVQLPGLMDGTYTSLRQDYSRHFQSLHAAAL